MQGRCKWAKTTSEQGHFDLLLYKADKDSCFPVIKSLTQVYHHLKYKCFVLTVFLAQVHHPLQLPWG